MVDTKAKRALLIPENVHENVFSCKSTNLGLGWKARQGGILASGTVLGDVSL